MSHFFCISLLVGDSGLYYPVCWGLSQFISQAIIGVRIKHAEQWERAFFWLKTGLMLAMNEGVRGTYYHNLSYYPFIFWLGQLRLWHISDRRSTQF